MTGGKTKAINDIVKLEETAKELRRIVLRLSYEKNKGHISSALSIIDILTVLYWNVLNLTPKNANSPSRDRFILSKGHAALALYAVLFKRDLISSKELESYGENGTILGVHPEFELNGVELSTGSLGHGLGVGAGIALGLKNDALNSKVFVLISDAECQEGSVWESALFSSHHKLDNLNVIIDYNKVQAFGKTNEITNLESLPDKWRAFGWNTYSTNGNDIRSLTKTFSKKNRNRNPNVFICNTITGKGVKFMEGQFKWHYLNLDKEKYSNSMEEVKAK